MQPTKELWAEIKEKLDRLHDPIYLDCDDYLVTAYLARVGKMKLAIRVYVNGLYHGKWMSASEPAEEGRRFYPLHRRQLYSATKKREFEKRFGKRAMRAARLDASYSFRGAYWTSANSLIRHLQTENQRITLLDAEEGHRRAKAAAEERLRASAAPRETEGGGA